MRTLEDLIKDIVVILENLRIDYAIVGGIAAVAWGNIRTTRDVDMIFLLKERDISKFVIGLKYSNFSITEDEVRTAMNEKGHFTIFDKLSVYHIDAKVAYGKTEMETLKHSRKIDLNGLNCYIASPEDTIANKLLFGREQDIKDSEGIYVRQLEKLDMKLLENRCKELKVWKEFLNMRKRVKKYLNEKK